MCDTLTEKAGNNRLIMEGHASAWHHQEEVAHSGFLGSACDEIRSKEYLSYT